MNSSKIGSYHLVAKALRVKDLGLQTHEQRDETSSKIIGTITIEKWWSLSFVGFDYLERRCIKNLSLVYTDSGLKGIVSIFHQDLSDGYYVPNEPISLTNYEDSVYEAFKNVNIMYGLPHEVQQYPSNLMSISIRTLNIDTNITIVHPIKRESTWHQVYVAALSTMIDSLKMYNDSTLFQYVSADAYERALASATGNYHPPSIQPIENQDSNEPPILDPW